MGNECNLYVMMIVMKVFQSSLQILRHTHSLKQKTPVRESF